MTKVYIKPCRPEAKPTYVASAYGRGFGKINPIFVYVKATGEVSVVLKKEYLDDTNTPISLTDEQVTDIKSSVRAEVLNIEMEVIQND